MQHDHKRLITRAAMCCALFLANTAAQAWQKATTEVVGFAYAAEDPNSEYGGSLIPGMEPGFRVYIKAAVPMRKIVAIKIDADSFAMQDSAGGKLAVQKSNMEFRSDVADNGSYALVPVSSESLPDKGTTSVEVTGAITCICGADQTTSDIDVALKKDAAFKLGGVDAKIVEVGEGYEEGTETITIETKQSLSQIVSMSYESGGKQHELVSNGSSSWGFGDDMTYQKGYQIKGKLRDVRKLKITYFQKLDEIKVPLKLKAQFGL